MTIIEAIQKVLAAEGKPLDHVSIYKRIVERGLYEFGAKDPLSVVRGSIRRHCYGIEFPSASPKKIFVEVEQKFRSRKSMYFLWDGERTQRDVDDSANLDLLPEEAIHKQYAAHIMAVKNQLLDYIRQSDPAFFEELVVKLLLRMGYGWDDSESGKVVGGSGDEGIDGIVSEDKLGLENIYIQAKRYSTANVPPSEVRDFIGAMAIRGARKGVLFASTDFSEQAKKHAEMAQNMNVTLVNGDSLADLLVEHEMGVAKIKRYQIYKVDKNYFSD